MSEFNLTAETKQQIIEQRLAQLNAEGYQHELNLKQLEAVDALESTEAEQTRQAIETIKTAIATCEAELA
jgi:hypothetical protein